VPSPNRPAPLLPQHRTSPATSAAHECDSPAETNATPDDKPDTVTGVNRLVVVPSPNWPQLFLPQHRTSPATNTAHECEVPAETDATPDDKPDTPMGVDRFVVVPSPNWPAPLLPQHRTAPDPNTAHECDHPAETDATPDDKPDTPTGVNRLVVVPSPNWPSALTPQHRTAPATNTAHECERPTETDATPDDKPHTVTGVNRLVVVPSPNWP